MSAAGLGLFSKSMKKHARLVTGMKLNSYKYEIHTPTLWYLFPSRKLRHFFRAYGIIIFSSS